MSGTRSGLGVTAAAPLGASAGKAMIIVLNGPLGIGKSTLAEALAESIDRCVMLDGDAVTAANPPPEDELAYLHATLALLVAHHRRFGYRHFVINHIWTTASSLADLREAMRSVDLGADVRPFLLTLPLEENLRRIARRQEARAVDESEHDLRVVAEERARLFSIPGDVLGEPFDVTDAPALLVERLLARLGLPRSAAPA